MNYHKSNTGKINDGNCITSNVWKGLVKAYDILGSQVSQKIGKGTKVKIVVDPWIGYGDNYRIYEPLRMHLHVVGKNTLQTSKLGSDLHADFDHKEMTF